MRDEAMLQLEVLPCVTVLFTKVPGRHTHNRPAVA